MSRQRKRLGIGIVLCAFLITGCFGKKTVNQPTLVTVSESDIYLDEILYGLYLAEQEGKENEAFYQSVFGKSYWESTDENNITYREQMKNEVLSNAIRDEILNQQAIKDGYTLTKEEMQTAKENAEEALSNLPKEEEEQMPVTKERLTDILSKGLMADRYYRDMEAKISIDADLETASLLEEDYEEYAVNYLYFPTGSYTENVWVPFDEKQVKKTSKAIYKLKESAKKSTLFSSLITAQMEEDYGAYASEIRFREGDMLLGALFEETALDLADGEISDVILEEDGYYLIQMASRHSLDTYQEVAEEAVNKAEKEALESAYETLKKEYKISVNEEIWQSLELGVNKPEIKPGG